MEHVDIVKEGDFYRLTPHEGYILKNVVTGMTYTDANTKNIKDFIVVLP